MQIPTSTVAPATLQPGGFVAGTLVHTSEGLKPVEQIKVGDLVLSKPESGVGESSYQPVTRTFRYEDRELYLLPFTELDPVTHRVVTGKTEYVAGTGAHPIWVSWFRQHRVGEGDDVITPVNGWVSVEEFYLKRVHQYWNAEEELEDMLCEPDAFAVLANGAPAILNGPNPILAGLREDEGVGFHDTEPWQEEASGWTLRFGPEGIESPGERTYLGNASERNYDYTGYDTESEMSVVRRSGGHLPTRRTVFNLEVAGNHSYFVGHLGLWVRGASELSRPELPAA